ITPPLVNIRVPWPDTPVPGVDAADPAQWREQPFLAPNPDQIPGPATFSRELLRARPESLQGSDHARRSSRPNSDNFAGQELSEDAAQKSLESGLSVQPPRLHLDGEDAPAPETSDRPRAHEIDRGEGGAVSLPWIRLIGLSWIIGS